MIEDLNKLICDNGICSIDSKFSEDDSWVSYDTEEYEDLPEEEYEDLPEEKLEDVSNDTSYGRFLPSSLSSIVPIRNENIFDKDYVFDYGFQKNNNFNLVINTIPNIDPKILSNYVKRVVFKKDGTIEVKFNAVLSDDIYKKLSQFAWYECEYFYSIRNEGVGFRSKPEGVEIILELFDSYGNITMKHKFENCLISSVEETPFGYDSDDLHVIQLNFNCDYHYVE
jgi:hypothetical protein